MPSETHPRNERSLGAREQLLLTRAQTARMLALSVSSVIRLELEGRLSAIKLSRKRSAKTFYRHDEVCALAEEGAWSPMERTAPQHLRRSAKKQSTD
jgi:hypothetical protein